METDLEKAQAVVEIDPGALDKECIRLPSDYLKFAHASADAKRNVAELRRKLDVVKADLARDVRTNPADFGLEKVTDAAVTNVLATDKSIIRANGELAEAEHQAELAAAVVWALEHKKRSLTLLVELHGMSYFSAPKMSQAGKEAVDQITKDRVRRRHNNDD